MSSTPKTPTLKTFVQPPAVVVDENFPTNLYRKDGPHFGPVVNGKGTTYETSGAVNNEDELEQALEAGFCRTLPEAVGLVPTAPLPSEVRALAAAEEAEKQKRFDDAVEAKVAAELAKKAGKPALSDESTGEVKAEVREALEAEAKSLGIVFDGRTTDKALSDKIAAKKKAA